MNISFSSNKLQKQLSDEKEMKKAFGVLRSKRLKIVMATLSAARSLAIFAPPYSPPHRCHELIGDRKGQLTMDLGHPYRLVFVQNETPKPVNEFGGLDWSKVGSILIIEIADTHG